MHDFYYYFLLPVSIFKAKVKLYIERKSRSGALNRLPSPPGYPNANQRHPNTQAWGAATLIDQRPRIVVSIRDCWLAREAPVHWGSRPPCLPTQSTRATRRYKSLFNSRLVQSTFNDSERDTELLGR